MTVKNIMCFSAVTKSNSPTREPYHDNSNYRQHSIIHVRVIPEPVASTVAEGAVVDEDCLELVLLVVVDNMGVVVDGPIIVLVDVVMVVDWAVCHT